MNTILRYMSNDISYDDLYDPVYGGPDDRNEEEEGEISDQGPASPEEISNPPDIADVSPELSKPEMIVMQVESVLEEKWKKDDSRKAKKLEESSPPRSKRRSPSYERARSRSRSPRSKTKRRSRSRSSSRGTFDGFEFEVENTKHDCPFSCKSCSRGFFTIRELAEHEIRAHDCRIPCPHCDRNNSTVRKLAEHLQRRHSDRKAECFHCRQAFGRIEELNSSGWDDYRSHVYKEILKKRQHELASKASGASSDTVALRGVGRCPHGAAVKCKNFPNCPGAKCIYSHGQCRYDMTCNKASCPFDHTNRPRTCMACVNEMKHKRRR